MAARIFLITLHIAAILVGIYGGYAIFNAVVN